MQGALDHLERNRDRYLDELFDYLRIPSVSAQPAHHEDCRRAAEVIRARAEAAGLETDVFEGDGLPTVHAWRIQDPQLPTLLVYGHYDVQPPEPLDLWETPPFEPTVVDGEIRARGCADDKGPSLALLLAAECLLKGEGALPLNLHFVLEGEEEVGGSVVYAFLNARKDRLKADALVIADSSGAAPDVPALTYGLRGITVTEVRVSGPSRDLHSGSYGGAVANPATAVARLVASLHDDGGRIAVDGFYDGVVELDEAERARLAGRPQSDDAFLAETGSPALFGEEGYTTSERRSARPTCEVNGIYGGYDGPGSKTIVPAKAGCKITCRLAPGQDPEHVLRVLDNHLRAHCPPGVLLEVESKAGAPAVLADPDSAWARRARRALADAYGTEAVLLREGGSIPVVSAFQEELAVQPLLLGTYAPDERAHSPNERYRVKDFYAGIRAGIHFFGTS